VTPHPSLEAGAVSPEPDDGRDHSVATPKERLRHAFSSEADIPADLLEPAAPLASEPDVYARSDREYEAYPAPVVTGGPVIRVVGVGGAGVNAVNRMVEADISGVEFLAINTDLQSLQLSAAHETLHIGDAVTRGLGSGSDPELGRRAAREEYDRIKAMLRGSDLVFIAAGAGGGTGTGAAPVVAQIARELGALTVGIVTRPFQFEGSRRREQAEVGISALAEEVDTLIVVPNNRLLSVLDRGVSMVEAFRVADDVLRQGVQGISDLVTLPGLINLDFADVRTIMSDAGTALLGIGMGSGERRAIDAAEQAVASPLLETSMEGARSILLSITGGRDISLWEVNEAAKAVAEAAHPDANIIFGAMVDESLEEQVWVTVVATGFGDGRLQRRAEEPFSLRSRVAEEPRRALRDPEPRRPLRDAEPRRPLREPAGEPRVSRVRRPSTELDVPEFIPRR
jgi:cell division protein FtsZ